MSEFSCPTCQDTGLDGIGLAAQACPVCGGSPHGEPEAEVVAEVAKPKRVRPSRAKQNIKVKVKE